MTWYTNKHAKYNEIFNRAVEAGNDKAAKADEIEMINYQQFIDNKDLRSK